MEILRAARVGDESKIARLEQTCFPRDAWSEAALLSYIEDESCIVLVAELDGAVSGYVLGRCIPPEAELYRCAVHPDMRRRGIGRALVGLLHGKLQTRGCEVCYLEVRALNAPARALYVSMGYERCGVRKHYYRDPVEDAVMKVKKLQG